MEITTYSFALTRWIGAPRARVFEALTTPDIAKHWWCSAPWKITSLVLDATPGGRFEFNMKNVEDGSKYRTHGEYTQAVPNERLAWTNAEGGGTLVEVDLFEGDNDRTELHVTQGPFPDIETRDAHSQGWSDALEQLDLYLQG
jgi:uncharacterized protein YndB with AHSA1/START domain